jgi:hypothetical protein
MSQDPLIGRVLLGQYTIEKKLGAGGFSTIYVADQPSLGRKVAIKTIHPHLASNADTVSRFHREGLAISRLKHPAIVEVFNLGQAEDGLLWIAMEFLEGESLASRLQRQGKVSPSEIVAMLKPVCEVLSEAHEQGIVHRDLKPENIMLMAYRGGWLPKVLDFGMASLQEGSSQSSTMVGGTFAYMPPEQWQGLKYTDARSDIYAMGVIAYQALAGRLPIEADAGAFLTWAQKHLNDPPLPLTEVEPPIAEAIYKALQKNQADRYQDIMHFWEALNQAVYNSQTAIPAATAQLGPPPGMMGQGVPPNATAQLGPPPGMNQSAPQGTAQLGPPPGMKQQSIPVQATAQLGPPPSMKQAAPPNTTAQLGQPPGMKQAAPPNATGQLGPPPGMKGQTPPPSPMGAKPLMGSPKSESSAQGILVSKPQSIAQSPVPQAPVNVPVAPGAAPIAPQAKSQIPVAPTPKVQNPVAEPTKGQSIQKPAVPAAKTQAPQATPKPKSVVSEIEVKSSNKPNPNISGLGGSNSFRGALNKTGIAAHATEDEEEEEVEDDEEEWEPCLAYSFIAPDGTLQAAYHESGGPFDLSFEDQEIKTQTDFAPSFAYDSYGDLYCAITAKNGKIYAGTFDDDDYLQLKHVGGAARSNAAPCLTLWNEELCIAIKGTDDHVYIGVAEDLEDLEFGLVDEESTTIATPAIVTSGDTLYCAITGSDNLVYIAYGDDLDDFSFAYTSEDFKTKQAPSLGYVGEQLFFGLTGVDNKPYLAFMNDDDVIAPWEIGDGHKTKLAPSIAVWGDTIYYALTNTSNLPCLALANPKERKPGKALRFYEVGEGVTTKLSPNVASEPPPEYYADDEEEEDDE